MYPRISWELVSNPLGPAQHTLRTAALDNNISESYLQRYRGSTVVKILCYKSEGRWFDSRWCHCIFPLTYFFRSHYGPAVDSASNRNEYQDYFLGVKAAGA
jgi:hypothetical protein